MSHHRHRRPARSRASQRIALGAAIALSLSGLFAVAPSRAETVYLRSDGLVGRGATDNLDCNLPRIGNECVVVECTNCAGTIPDEKRAQSQGHHHVGPARPERPLGLHRQPGEGGGRARSHLCRRSVAGRGARASRRIRVRAGLRLRSASLQRRVRRHRPSRRRQHLRAPDRRPYLLESAARTSSAAPTSPVTGP